MPYQNYQSRSNTLSNRYFCDKHNINILKTSGNDHRSGGLV